MAPEKPSSRGQAWFCTTGLPSDVVVEVDDMTFHLHKFPLMSKSHRLHQLITEQETTKPSSSGKRTAREDNQETEGHETELDGEDDEGRDEAGDGYCCIPLQNFPGGSETFEIVAKFCYGVKIELSASNVAPLRCAGEYLEMTEEYSEENLISKTELFLSQTVFKSLRESVRALKSCESVSELAETLGITQRCVDSVASRAFSADPTLFGWPVSEVGSRKKNDQKRDKSEAWFEDLAHLSLQSFERLILEMRSRDLNPEIIESCIINYAKKHVPGLSRSSRKPPASSTSMASENQQTELLETLVAKLPSEKTSRSSTTRFLFGLLRTAKILNASESCRSKLEKKIGSQLEQATLDDLLIPSYSYLNETLYDVDCVGRILSYFLDGLEERCSTELEADRRDQSPALMLVGKLFDGYLAEIASDSNLKPERFHDLAISLPNQARLFDDGIYRAIDVYLKSHPWISEGDREKICSLMDCQKLTLDACTHAAQNERLPLRAVVQVLFFEQLQLRHAIAGTLLSPAPSPEPGRRSMTRTDVTEEEEEGPAAEAEAAGGHVEGRRWRETLRENQVLRMDMDSMRTRVHHLERECSSMRKVILKIDKVGSDGGGKSWSLTKKFGCKFRTQVCDSHEATAVDSRKGKHR